MAEKRLQILAFLGMEQRLPPDALRAGPVSNSIEVVNAEPGRLPLVVPRQVPRFGHEDTNPNTVVPFQKPSFIVP